MAAATLPRRRWGNRLRPAAFPGATRGPAWRSTAALALFALALLAAALVHPAGPALAQAADASPTSPSGASPDVVARTAPPGSTAVPTPGEPQIGAPTPTEEHDERKAGKAATSVCEGC